VRTLDWFLAAAVLGAGVLAAGGKQTIPFADARTIVEEQRGELPAELAALAPAALEAAWPGWIAQHDAAIRGRLAEGDEDSVVNLWLYGTSFTRRPRVTDQEAARLANPAAVEELLLQRLDNFVAALAAPGSNERLQFARDLLARKGIAVATPAGRQRARIYLVGVRERVIAQNERYRRAAESPSAYATLFRDRGLSSDTRLTASFAIDAALQALAASGQVPQGSISRVAIAGPGLDFTDKAEGYDFYPPQTIQPFALIDALRRLKLARSGLKVVTLDLSPRVNAHLAAARRRAATGASYTIQLPLAEDDEKHRWHPDLVAYWRQFGGEIGRAATPIAPPVIAGKVRVRAVAIPPSVVATIAPRDLNVIVERLDLADSAERFDLIVATNILVYYDTFDQALALSNVAAMLKPGGFFLTNYAVTTRPPLEPSASVVTPVFFDREGNGDTVYAYRLHKDH
jgi:SAM-dependent methyltransferase